MGTRSHIGIMGKNGKIKVIHCQHDGYLAFTGKRLIESHNSLPLAKQLIKGGNMSFVGAPFDNSAPMKFETLSEYRFTIMECFDDIEFFYLYHSDNWWYSANAGKDWDLVKNNLGE